jgi:hypothetical protein
MGLGGTFYTLYTFIDCLKKERRTACPGLKRGVKKSRGKFGGKGLEVLPGTVIPIFISFYRPDLSA